jgi:hypothetical protein
MATLSTASINDIKQWLATDLQIEKLTKQLEELRSKKDILEPKIVDNMNAMGLNKTILNIDKYKLNVMSENNYTHLSYTFLEKSLKSIMAGDEAKVKSLITQIKGKRDKKIVYYLKRSESK